MVLEQQIDGFARARAQSQTALVDDCRSGAATDWKGPERRAEATSTARWLAQMLDEGDYGMLLLVDAARVLHANHADTSVSEGMMQGGMMDRMQGMSGMMTQMSSMMEMMGGMMDGGMGMGMVGGGGSH